MASKQEQRIAVRSDQLANLVAGGVAVRLPGQAVLAGLQEGFGSFVVDGCGYTLSPTDLRYRRLASETFKNDTDLLICGELLDCFSPFVRIER